MQLSERSHAHSPHSVTPSAANHLSEEEVVVLAVGCGAADVMMLALLVLHPPSTGSWHPASCLHCAAPIPHLQPQARGLSLTPSLPNSLGGWMNGGCSLAQWAASRVCNVRETAPQSRTSCLFPFFLNRNFPTDAHCLCICLSSPPPHLSPILET